MSSSSLLVAPPPPPLPRFFTVPYTILKDTDGRDKVLKTFQYLCRWLKWLTLAYPRHAHACAHAVLTLQNLVVPSSLWSAASATASAASAATRTASVVAAAAAASTPSSAATAAIAAATAAVATPAAHLLTDFRSFVDGVVPTIGATRRVIRIFKWGYTVPILHRNYHKWRWETARLRDARESGASASTLATAASITRLPLPGLDWLPLVSTVEVANNIVAELTDMADDVYWYASFRFLPKGWAPTAARAVILLWFATVLVDLVLTGRQLKMAVAEWRADLRKLMLARSTYDQYVIDLSVGKTRSDVASSAALSQQIETAQLAVDKSQDVAWGHFLNMVKFIGDFGVALPSAFEVQNTYDGTVQFSGFLSAFAATVKLIPAAPRVAPSKQA